MANTPRNDDLSLQLRQTISDAYAFVRSREVSSSFSAVTFEDLAQQQLERLSGNGTPTRPSYAARVEGVANAVRAAAEKIKSLPADAFKNTNKNVNTPVLQPLAKQYACDTHR